MESEVVVVLAGLEVLEGSRFRVIHAHAGSDPHVHVLSLEQLTVELEGGAYRGDQSKEVEKKEAWSVKPATESSSD